MKSTDKQDKDGWLYTKILAKFEAHTWYFGYIRTFTTEIRTCDVYQIHNSPNVAHTYADTSQTHI